jgi:hypothetical protein
MVNRPEHCGAAYVRHRRKPSIAVASSQAAFPVLRKSSRWGQIYSSAEPGPQSACSGSVRVRLTARAAGDSELHPGPPPDAAPGRRHPDSGTGSLCKSAGTGSLCRWKSSLRLNDFDDSKFSDFDSEGGAIMMTIPLQRHAVAVTGRGRQVAGARLRLRMCSGKT